jgi:hypothetical protein
MAMKKTSGGDSPLRQGAKKSFWTLPISGQRWRRIAMFSRKVIGCLGFSSRGVFIGEGAVSEVDQGGLTTRGRGPALGRTALWCGRPVAPLHLLFSLLEAPLNIWTSGFDLSNSENISYVTFLKHQNSRKQGTGTVASH